MNDNEKLLIALVKSAITSEVVELPNKIDWGYINNISIKQNIIALVFCGLSYANIDESTKEYAVFSTEAMKYINYAYLLDSDKEAIFRLFDDEKIDYLPLKGSVIRSLYPDISMRFMSDVDILIKEDSYDGIKTVLINNDYTFVEESNHEIVWKSKNETSIELHKHLIPTYNTDYYEYFERQWERAVLDSGKTSYHLTNEDMFIYAFVHMSKHFRDGGIGINHIVDLWIMKDKLELDFKYIKAELSKLKLAEFLGNTLELIDCWFYDGEENPRVKFMSEWIFNSSSYSNAEKHELAMSLRTMVLNNSDSVHSSLVKNSIFPSLKDMKKVYPILDKVPILLPLLWVYRIFYKLIFKFTNVKKRYNHLKRQSDDRINDYKDALAYLGLNFDIKKEKD